MLNPLYAVALVPVLRGFRTWLTLLSALLLGFVLKPEPQPLIKVEGGVFDGEALVITIPQSVRNRLVTVVEAGDKRYRLSLPVTADANLGDRVKLRADIRPLPIGAVPQRLEVAALWPQGRVQIIRSGADIWRVATRARNEFLGFFERYGEPTTTGLVHALAFNVTGDLGNETYENLKRTGTIHIVSASGMHVTIVAALLAWALLLTPIPRWVQLLTLGFLLLLYAAAAGLHPPMIRAVATVMVGSAAFAFRREPDALSALSIAGIGTLLWEPEAVGNVGFLLSYLSVGALVVFATLPRVPKELAPRVFSAVGAMLRASIVAWLGTAPLVAHTFGQLSLVSVVSNFFVVPVLALVVTASLAAWSLSPLLPVGVGIAKTLVDPFAGWILGVVETTGKWPWASIDVPHAPVWVIVVIYLALAALYRPRRRHAEELTIW